MPGSMTGYGHAEEGGYLVEIKGLNHRYKDLRVKLPRDLTPLEMQVRTLVSDAIQRGKIDVVVTRDVAEAAKAGLRINWEYAGVVFRDLQAAAGKFGGEVSFRDVISIPGVLGEEDRQLDELWMLISSPLGKALKHFLNSRMEEGDKLAKDMKARIQTLDAIRGIIEAGAGRMPEIYAAKLQANIGNLFGAENKIDEVRLAQEVAIMAERSDITEELVRLKSHFETFIDTLASEGSTGRRLEFILQEINREINTIGSKSQDTEISMKVIDAKTEVEKIREQLQNIE
jgi:uncharacterized protein (TIGR00255 family)